jgi:protein translocase SecG subunit
MKGLTAPVIIFGIISLVSAIALILSVMFQTTKAESFSAALGSGSETRFKPGSREEWLYKITRVSAITWIISLLFMSIFYYNAVE